MLDARQRGERQVVRVFRIQAEEQGAGERVGNESHAGRSRVSVLDNRAIVANPSHGTLPAMTQDELKALVGGKPRWPTCNPAASSAWAPARR